MYNNWDEIIEDVRKCQKCEICNSKKMEVKEIENKRVIFLVMNNLSDEDKKIFDMAVELSKINKEEIYFTRAIKCECNNANVFYANNCLDYLRGEVIFLKPRIIFLFGKDVIKLILKEEKNFAKVVNMKNISYICSEELISIKNDNMKKIRIVNDLKLINELSK